MDKDKIVILKLRSRFTQAIRNFFVENSYLEVETPLFSPFLIPEPALEVFKADYIDFNGTHQAGYLIPSPELWMKRLLSYGMGNIFQITKCFRNIESIGRLHNPEFTMLEWYTVQHTYLDSIEVMERLLKALYAQCPETGVKTGLLPLKRLSMQEAFRQILAIDLDALMDKTALFKQACRLNLLCTENGSWEELFNQIFLTFIEPELARAGAVVLYNYPAQIPTLAKRAADPHYAERWELYIDGIEIANCFSEETAPARLQELLTAEALRKETDGIVKHTMDRELPAFFHDHYPVCSGVALGIDRLLMSLVALDSIDKVLAFPFAAIFGS